MKSLIKRIRYRLWQVQQERHPTLCFKQWETAINIFPKNIKEILNQHSIAEKAHLLRIFKRIEADESFGEQHETYLRLALLHDIGKLKSFRGVWIKVLKVLLHYDFTKHAQKGAEMLRNLEVDERLIELVRVHHLPSKNALIQRFQEYDDCS